MIQFMKNIYRLCKMYWGVKQNYTAWIILVVILAINAGVANLNVWINDWSRSFYDALAAIKISEAADLLYKYMLLIGAYIIVSTYRTWIIKLLKIRWRKHFTEAFLGKWFSDNVYYRMSKNRTTDNPDQRIAEDIRNFIDYVVLLLLDFVMQVYQLTLFLKLLYTLSGSPEFNIFGHKFQVDGYLLYVAILYGIMGTIVTHLFGRRLEPLNYQQERYEAEFRASLVRKQDNAEQISFYRGDSWEMKALKKEFKNIAKNWRALMNVERNVGFLVGTYSRLADMLPILLSMPLLAAKIITFGGLMQIRSAFAVVVDGFSWFIYAYSRLASLSAIVKRLVQFQEEMERVRAEVKIPAGNSDNPLEVQNLAIFTTDNEPLLNQINLSITPNKWVCLKGNSGLGKSTMFRVLNGLWDHYDGDYYESTKRTLFIPQSAYLNEGTLAELLSYPALENYSDEEINRVLGLVGLEKWQNRLEEQHLWSRVFSGGEQQLISFARILLHKPEVIYLDEVTSNLDEPTARKMFSLVKTNLPSASVIFITHQVDLREEFAEQIIDMTQFKA